MTTDLVPLLASEPRTLRSQAKLVDHWTQTVVFCRYLSQRYIEERNRAEPFFPLIL